MNTKLQEVFRKDYQQPDYWIETVDLFFELNESHTTVRSKIQFVRNEDSEAGAPLVLTGEEVELKSVKIDGRELSSDEFSIGEDTLTVNGLGERSLVEIEVIIHPETNTTMMGLYKSSGNFCTQCESEGFRRITYFLDRPDVMACYTTTIDAEEERYPILLSNGNRVDEGKSENGRHWVRWEDPFPKPSYLFALVSGDLSCRRDEFTTASGRKVALEIYVEHQNIDACDHAMVSLQKSMKWDEEVYGLEYDLDLYMIVAVGDFNMGAMENKGLNVFNTKYVLAKPDTATDSDYEGVEGVIAHEYFHNWTGNRVTCRDWFQLTLKEGLTVFRDQQFTSDMTSAPVKRIADVKVLRMGQFAEDAGPMAHPIRPESYVEMNNFYTSTVYRKGSEVIRMYHTLLGAEGFRKGMDLYFERHDNSAVECDDFRAAMADANGADLGQFERWYLQAGTPFVRAAGEYDAAAQTYSLQLKQSCRETTGLPSPKPFHIPVRLGLVGPTGNDLPLYLKDGASGENEMVLDFTEQDQLFVFTDVAEEPVPSLFRGFSAPIKLVMDRSNEELAFLISNDSDSFNRWDAGQELATQLLLELTAKAVAGETLKLDPLFIDSIRRVLQDDSLDGSLKALALGLPTPMVISQQLDVVDPDAVHSAREFVVREVASALKEEFAAIYSALNTGTAYSADKESIDGRRLKNAALGYLTSLEQPELTQLAADQFAAADNMTDAQASLFCLVETDSPSKQEALQAFYDKWHADPLVMDKWFSVQALSSREDTFASVKGLSEHADFTLENPNRVRALLSAFCRQNQVRFHQTDGAAYEFIADKVLELDRLNPQVAASLVASFNQWKRYDSARQDLMKAQLERIAGTAGLSKDVGEIVARSLSN
jgi:aminopeptidase N